MGEAGKGTANGERPRTQEFRSSGLQNFRRGIQHTGVEVGRFLLKTDTDTIPNSEPFFALAFPCEDR
jgi:hypothetical protein